MTPFLSSAALMEYVEIQGSTWHRLLQRKGARLLWFSLVMGGWRPSPHAVQWSHRETHSLIKTCSTRDLKKNWPFDDLSTCGVLVSTGRPKTHKTELKPLWARTETSAQAASLAHSTSVCSQPHNIISLKYKNKEHQEASLQHLSQIYVHTKLLLASIYLNEY